MQTKVLISQLWNIPSRFGDKMGWNWLTYNPGVFLEFALVARRNSPFFADAIAKVFPHAQRICDIGAGTGQFVQALQRLHKDVDGFEYSTWGRLFARFIGIHLGTFDLTVAPFLSEVKKYDLAFSLEVGEHIPTFLSGQFVKILTEAAPIVVLTCAGRGQTGHGHINCQDKSFWIDLFAQESFICSDSDLESLHHELIRHPRLSSFITSNLMVFKKTEA
jgi:hypothetical protein